MLGHLNIKQNFKHKNVLVYTFSITSINNFFLKKALKYIFFYYKKYKKQRTSLIIEPEIKYKKEIPFIDLCSINVLPQKKKKFTYLRSPHVHKRAQEHFGIVLHKICLCFKVSIVKKDYAKLALKQRIYLNFINIQLMDTYFKKFLNRYAFFLLTNVSIKIKRKIVVGI